MDEKSLEILEFPRIREILSGYTSFSAAKELALNLTPSSDEWLVSLYLNQAKEARAFLSLEPGFSAGEIQDVRDQVKMAAKGKVLDPEVLVSIQRALAGARYVRGRLSRYSAEFPLLWDIAQRVVPLAGLEADISHCINLNGEILDTASDKLTSIKQRLKEVRQQIVSRLDKMVKSGAYLPYLQDSLITEREGRYVIPVKVESRRDVRGIVHDVSNTGATIFIEPMETVEMGNELRELVIAEKQEIEHILASLSEGAGANEEIISQNIGVLAELELILAKARYADKVKAIVPDISGGDDKIDNNSRVLHLVNARHPLLKGNAVPITVEINKDFGVLVITGPNTGGKTVTLKTIGLLAIMAQAGLPIPAGEGTAVPIFDGIFADIGDEQSIEQTLSTFNWHMNNIVRFVNGTTSKSLVLVDELGTSTDPAEGSALARAILLYFLLRGVMTVATTHFSELKAFAHTTPGIENAALDFDPVTFMPTYHLTVGIPGGSNALATASRLGLSPEIIASARGMLSQGSVELEQLISSLMKEKQKAESLKMDLEKKLAETEKEKKELDAELAGFAQQEQRILRETRDRLVEKTAELQREIKETSAHLRRAKSLEDIERAKKSLAATQNSLRSDAFGGTKPRVRANPDRTLTPERIEVGDTVWIMDTNLRGTVTSVGKQVEVQVGGKKVRVSPDNLAKVDVPMKEVSPSVATITTSAMSRVRPEINLRGKRADEVEAELDHYLNDASLAGLSQVRIIHGIATGVVRQIVRDFLASHPLVKSFHPGGRNNGGDGVTIAVL
jgi:DNA mismatch repair protein MutS2